MIRQVEVASAPIFRGSRIVANPDIKPVLINFRLGGESGLDCQRKWTGGFYGVPTPKSKWWGRAARFVRPDSVQTDNFIRLKLPTAARFD